MTPLMEDNPSAVVYYAPLPAVFTAAERRAWARAKGVKISTPPPRRAKRRPNHASTRRP
jgi:hypothetical protein